MINNYISRLRFPRALCLLWGLVVSISGCLPDTRAVLEMDLPNGRNCTDFQSDVLQALKDLPLSVPEEWPEVGWVAHNEAKFILLQHKSTVDAYLNLTVSKKKCHLEVTWRHNSVDPVPIRENREMFFRVMSALQDAFGKDAVRVTKRGHYFDR